MDTNKKPISCLDESCYEAIGKILYAGPAYGWGWTGNPEAPFVPKPFEFMLGSLWKRENGLTGGGVGTITETKHHYNGWYFIFTIRHLGRFNFTDRIGHFNVFITKEFRFRLKDGQPVPVRKKGGCSGYALIGYREHIDK
jgi:hypothetical protein